MRKPSGTSRCVYRSVPECSSLIFFRTWPSLFLLPACLYHARNSNTKEGFRCLSLFRSRMRTPSLFSCSRLRHGHSFLSHSLIYGLLRSRFYKVLFSLWHRCTVNEMWFMVCKHYSFPDSTRWLFPS
jgi:hypothetical protein